MTRQCEAWPGFTNISSESERYKRIQQVFSSANFEYLKKRGIESRRTHQTNVSPDVSCNIHLDHFTSGANNLVVELAFSDDVFWVARIPYQPMDEVSKISLLSEIGTMNVIRKRTSVPVPQIFEFEISADQPFGYPYIFMEYLGSRLNDGLAVSIPLENHSKVAKQLANVFVDLQNLTFDRIGRLWCGETADQPIEIIGMEWHHSPGPLDTSLEYFFAQRQGENRESIVMHPNDPDWLTACWVLTTALPLYIIEDRVCGPFPLCHLDLHFGNLLFDTEYNLTAVIDWNSAQAAPIEQLSICPEFVTFPGLSEEQNRPIVDFKNLVIQFIKELEKQKPPSLTPLSTYMASKRAEIAYRQYMASPKSILWTGKLVAKLIYSDDISWEQLRKVYGTKAFPIS